MVIDRCTDRRCHPARCICGDCTGSTAMYDVIPSTIPGQKVMVPRGSRILIPYPGAIIVIPYGDP